MEESVSKFGERLKRARLEQGLTLRKLAEAARVSPGTVQKIEAARLVPSIEIFAKIVRALHRSPSYFFGEGENQVNVRIIRASEMQSIAAASSIRILNIAKTLHDPRMEAFLVRLPPHTRSGRPIGTYGELLFIMKKGMLNFMVNGKREVLREGDTLHLKAQVPHRYENKTGTPAEFLAIWSPL